MYDWRNMTPEQRMRAMAYRREQRLPWHSPPHYNSQRTFFHIVTACYEHRHIIGHTPDRMVDFERTLYETLDSRCEQVLAWCVLSNHYHVLIKTMDFPSVVKELGRMHGRISHQWNGEEARRGRKCWHRCRDRVIRSNRHKWVSMNYIHHNPVHHGYVSKWQEWPFSSADAYLEKTDPAIVKRMWKEYPLHDYGRGWDEPEL